MHLFVHNSCVPASTAVVTMDAVYAADVECSPRVGESTKRLNSFGKTSVLRLATPVRDDGDDLMDREYVRTFYTYIFYFPFLGYVTFFCPWPGRGVYNFTALRPRLDRPGGSNLVVITGVLSLHAVCLDSGGPSRPPRVPQNLALSSGGLDVS